MAHRWLSTGDPRSTTLSLTAHASRWPATTVSGKRTQLRALEGVVALYRHNNNCSIEAAKAAVLAELAKGKTS